VRRRARDEPGAHLARRGRPALAAMPGGLHRPSVGDQGGEQRRAPTPPPRALHPRGKRAEGLAKASSSVRGNRHRRGLRQRPRGTCSPASATGRVAGARVAVQDLRRSGALRRAGGWGLRRGQDRPRGGQLSVALVSACVSCRPPSRQPARVPRLDRPTGDLGGRRRGTRRDDRADPDAARTLRLCCGPSGDGHASECCRRWPRAGPVTCRAGRDVAVEGSTSAIA
jgi:hypothetical protein